MRQRLDDRNLAFPTGAARVFTARLLVAASVVLAPIPAVWAADKGAAVAADGFVSEIDDLPLPAGFEEIENRGFVFDKPAGRIVEAYASGSLAREKVEGFYLDALPQLGWRRRGAATAEEGGARDFEFQREDEILLITITESDQRVFVRFSLSPVQSGR